MNVWFRRWKCRMNYRRQKYNRVLAFVLAFLILFLATSYFQKTIKPMFRSLAVNNAKVIAVRTVERAIGGNQMIQQMDYTDLIKINKRADDTITSVTADTVKINQIRSQLAQDILDSLSQIDPSQVGVPVGSLFGGDLFAGMGHRIPVKISPFGYVNVDFESSFIAAGINQTKHEINLKVTTEVSVLLPTGVASTQVETTVPMTQTIIVGNIPDSYININGIKQAEDFVPNLVQ